MKKSRKERKLETLERILREDVLFGNNGDYSNVMIAVYDKNKELKGHKVSAFWDISKTQAKVYEKWTLERTMSILNILNFNFENREKYSLVSLKDVIYVSIVTSKSNKILNTYKFIEVDGVWKYVEGDNKNG